jgi:hypothetical protein
MNQKDLTDAHAVAVAAITYVSRTDEDILRFRSTWIEQNIPDVPVPADEFTAAVKNAQDVLSTVFCAFKIRRGVSSRIVDAFIGDLTSRSGFDAVWDDIDEETRNEIRKKLKTIVSTELSDNAD